MSHVVVPVLIVDDDADIRATMRDVLEDGGYTVFEAPDGKPALARLRESSERIVVLLDLRMPGMDGRQVIEAVARQDTLATRHSYVLVTANADSLPLEFAHLLAQLQVLVMRKPFDLTELLRVVAQAAAKLESDGWRGGLA